MLLWLLSGRANAITLGTRIAYVVTVPYSIYPFLAAPDFSTAILLVVMLAVALTAALALVRPAASRS